MQVLSDDRSGARSTMSPTTWVKIGEHLDRETLKRAAETIRARWAGRYDFRINESDISESDDKVKGFELRLRHR